MTVGGVSGRVPAAVEPRGALEVGRHGILELHLRQTLAGLEVVKVNQIVSLRHREGILVLLEILLLLHLRRRVRPGVTRSFARSTKERRAARLKSEVRTRDVDRHTRTRW